MDFGVLFLPAMILVMYFFFIRPQMSRQKAMRTLQEGLKKGVRVVTASGIHGKIADINEANATVFLDVGKTTIQIDRSAIASLESDAKKSK